MRPLAFWGTLTTLLACVCGGGDEPGGSAAREAAAPTRVTLRCRHTDATETLKCPAGAACPADGTEVYCAERVEILDGADGESRINNWESDGVWDRVRSKTALVRAAYHKKESEGGGFETELSVFGSVVHVRPLPVALAEGDTFIGRATIADYDEGMMYDDLVLEGAATVPLEQFERDAALEALDGLLVAWQATPQDPAALERLRQAAFDLGTGPDTAAVFLLRGTSREALPESVQLGATTAAAGTALRSYSCLWGTAKTQVACGTDEACLPDGALWVCPELFAALPAESPEGGEERINNWHRGDTFASRKDKLLLFAPQEAAAYDGALPESLGGGTARIARVGRPRFYVYGSQVSPEELSRGAFVGAYRAYEPGMVIDDLWVEHLAGLPAGDPRIAAIRAYPYAKGAPLPADTRRGVAREETLRDAVMPPGAEETWIRTALRAAGTSWDEVKKAGDAAQARREAEVRAALEGDAWGRLREVARPWDDFREQDAWALPTDSSCGRTPEEGVVADRAKAAAALTQAVWRLPLDVAVEGDALKVNSDDFAVVGAWKIKQEVSTGCSTVCCPVWGGACRYRMFGCEAGEAPRQECSRDVSRSWDLPPVTLTLALPAGLPAEGYEGEAVVAVAKVHRDCNEDSWAGTVYSGKVLGVRVTRAGETIHEDIRRPVTVEEALAGAGAFRP